MVETSAVVLPGDASRKFDQLSIAELIAETRKQTVRNFYGSTSHPIRKRQDEPLEVGETRIRRIGVKIGNLVG